MTPRNPLSVLLSLVFMCLVEFTVRGLTHRNVSLYVNNIIQRQTKNTKIHLCISAGRTVQSGAQCLYVYQRDLFTNNSREAERTAIFIYRL